MNFDQQYLTGLLILLLFLIVLSAASCTRTPAPVGSLERRTLCQEYDWEASHPSDSINTRRIVDYNYYLLKQFCGDYANGEHEKTESISETGR